MIDNNNKVNNFKVNEINEKINSYHLPELCSESAAESSSQTKFNEIITGNKCPIYW
jgi:hypothetical protein